MNFFSLPQILGYIAYTISLTAAMQKNDKRLFLLFAVSSLIFSVHHFMLGNVSAALSKIVVGTRMYANIYFKGAIVAFPFAFITIASGYYGTKTFTVCCPSRRFCWQRSSRRIPAASSCESVLSSAVRCG